MPRVISFSLWGSDPMYHVGLMANLKLAPEIYPGWQCWVYVDETVPAETRQEIVALGGHPRDATPTRNKFDRGWSGLFNRFQPAGNPYLDAMIVRDADSRLNIREAAAVTEWLESGKKFHCMRDHIQHTTVPIMGGMWGCRPPIEDWINMLMEWPRRHEKGSDQDFMATIWPLVREQAIVHDRYHNGVLAVTGGQEFMPCSAPQACVGRDPAAPPMFILPNGETVLQVDAYHYHPTKFHGEHDVRPFPAHAAYEGFVGEIIT